jgi:hypothetical protein
VNDAHEDHDAWFWPGSGAEGAARGLVCKKEGRELVTAAHGAPPAAVSSSPAADLKPGASVL